MLGKLSRADARVTAPAGRPSPTPGEGQQGLSATGPDGASSQRAGSAAVGAGAATALLPASAAGPDGKADPSAAPKPKPASVRRTRKARLRLSRLDPWSVMKTAFLFSIAAGIMLVVAVYAVWAVLSTSGLFTSVNELVAAALSTPGDTTPFQIQNYLNTQRIMGVTALIACIDVLIFTSLATLGAFLYNLAATMLGGLEITLAED